MAWRPHIERITTKALATNIRTYTLFKSDHLNINIQLTLYDAQIRSIMAYACCTWKYVADSHFLKQQHLQNQVLRAVGNLDRHTLVHEMRMAPKFLAYTAV
jgi:hypothetical protein